MVSDWAVFQDLWGESNFAFGGIKKYTHFVPLALHPLAFFSLAEMLYFIQVKSQKGLKSLFFLEELALFLATQASPALRVFLRICPLDMSTATNAFASQYPTILNDFHIIPMM